MRVKSVCLVALSFALVGPLRAEPLKEAQTFTLQFQDIEVRRAIHTLGELAHKDVVVSDGVSGTMSLNLVDVTWHQALELILHTQNLAQQRVGDVLTIAPVEQFEAVRKAKLQRQQELLQLQPLATELLQIRYARADALAELFVKKGSRLLSKRGAVAVDERTNTLVVTDTAERLAWVRRTLATLDKPLRQVQIEARIAIVSSNLSEQLGFRWQLGGTQTRHDGAVIEASAVAGRAASGVGVALVDLGYARPTSWLDSQLSALASKGQA